MSQSYDRINSICLIIIASVATTVALLYTKVILVPFVISFFVFAVMLPVINWFDKRLKFKKIFAIIVTIIFFSIIFTLLCMLIVYSLYNFFESADIYKERIFEFFNGINKVAEYFNITINAELMQDTIKKLPMFAMARNITTAIGIFFSNMVLVSIFVLFFLIGESVTSEPNKIVAEIRMKISRYAITKLVTSLITGLLVFVLLAVCGIELAFLFAVLTVLLNFIPNVGSIIATILPLPVIILQYGFGWQIIVFLPIALIIQFSIGNIVEPKLMGESMGLHPVTVLLSLMFWGLIWGIPGMFLAVPITATVKMILNRDPVTRPIANMLAGQF